MTGGREAYLGDLAAYRENREQRKALETAQLRHQELERDEKWKEAQCRLCPQCFRGVEKISGCDSMHCGQDAHGGSKQQGCGEQEFAM